eukprot:GGOE01021545.1.p1 GENE.GGOE01021545.1~~GGOE01021545.1.p1  ORF type:complete len:358 (-),score=92.78 GGOE01021545.1:93-1055(-)
MAHEYFSRKINDQPHPAEERSQQPRRVLRAEPEKPPFPSDPSRPVVYLIQLEGISPVPKMGEADVLCVTWKQELAPCDFIPGSSWTQGRNALWKKVTTMQKKYMYYVFMDEDITLSNLSLFELSLVKWQPPIGVPAGIAQLQGVDENRYEALKLHSFDAAFNAFHYDVVHSSLVLPYVDLFDHFSWWSSQLYMIYLCQVFFDNEVIGFMRVKSTNAQHRPYPRGWNMTALDQFWRQHVVVDDHMRLTWKGYSWTTSGPASPKPGLQRYYVPEEFLALPDSETVFWRRIAEIKSSSNGRPPLALAKVDIAGEDFQKMFGIK